MADVASAHPGALALLSRCINRERRPLVLALLLSLLIHALLLSLMFGGEALGLPGLAFPWRDRRIEVPDLRIVLVPAQVAPAGPAVPSAEMPLQRGSMEFPVAAGPSPTRPGLPAPVEPPSPAAANTSETEPTVQADATRNLVVPAVPVQVPVPAAEPDRVAPAQIPAPPAIDVEPSVEPAPAVLAAPVSPVSVTAAAPSASSPPAVPSLPRVSEDAVLEAQRQEAVRVEAARKDAERQEAARQAAAQQEAQRLEAAAEEAARVEAARKDAERQEATRQVAAQLEAQRQEAARQEAARAEAVRRDAERQDAERQEAARQEAARQEAARQEAARQEAARQGAARQAAAQQEAQRQEAARQATAARATASPEPAHVEAGQDAEARRDAVLRAIGRQLDEEAARRDAASAAARLPNALPYSLSTARRVRLWGRADPNVELVQYGEAWARKIQFNTAVDTVRELAKQAHTPPMVTVAVRSDGSVESVTFVVSSGVADIDEAIRRIVESQRPYPAFPPALAREFDVVEIRRTWYFDSAVRLN